MSVWVSRTGSTTFEDGVDDLRVGARLPVGLERPDVDAHPLECQLDLLADGPAEQCDGAAGSPELCDYLGYVDSLAARILSQLGNAVDGVQGKSGDRHRLVERGVERNGVDHSILLSTVEMKLKLSKQKSRVIITTVMRLSNQKSKLVEIYRIPAKRNRLT